MRKCILWLVCLWMLVTGFQLNAQQQEKPSIPVIFGDDIDMWNVGAYTHGITGMTTIDIPGSTSVNNNALPKLWQLAKTDELQAQANHFVGNSPTEWLTGVITRDKVQYRPPGPGGDVAYYGHRIPVAGRIILNIGQKAQSHPRITRVLESLDPGFGPGSGNRQPLRGIRK